MYKLIVKLSKKVDDLIGSKVTAPAQTSTKAVSQELPMTTSEVNAIEVRAPKTFTRSKVSDGVKKIRPTANDVLKFYNTRVRPYTSVDVANHMPAKFQPCDVGHISAIICNAVNNGFLRREVKKRGKLKLYSRREGVVFPIK